ncbi:MAG: hypothetical protein ACK58L_16605, partial [Planctomycetota bacterium]
YRIDAVDSCGQLIEVQCASLAAIRGKIARLLSSHDVIVVKPLAARKKITTLHRKGGEIVRSRFSPMKATLAHLFLELVHFPVFPNKRLRLDVLLTEQEEIRIPPSEYTSWRKRFSVEDRSLVSIRRCVELRTARDLWNALDLTLPKMFTTADIQKAGQMPRWLAQKIAWCFRRMDFFKVCGKSGNSLVYRHVGHRGRRGPAAA